MNKDYYSILGLSKDASIGEIKTAYRKLAHKFHPDKNPGDPFFENMFREVNEAYNALITFKKGEPNSTKVHTNNPPPPSNENAKKTFSQYDNAIQFANQVEDQYRKIKWLEEDQVDKNKLTEYLNTMLTDRVINELKSIDHFDSNYRIIDTVTGMFQFLKKESVDEYSVKLANLAKSNNELNLLIYRKAKERSKELKNRKIWKYVKIIGAIAIITYFIHLYQEDSKSREQRTRENQSTSRPTLPNLDKPSTNSNPIPSKWKNNHLKTGDSPYNDHFGNGVYDKNYQNEITVKNGQTTDVIVCLTQYYPPKRTIRNEYIRAGDSFKMTNIPNGTYFIKSFYGKYWNPEIKVVGAAKGYFDTLAGFSKSDNYDDLLVMDQDEYHYSIYELTLYPVIGGNMESEPINLHEFFRE